MGIDRLIRDFRDYGPHPQPRPATTGTTADNPAEVARRQGFLVSDDWHDARDYLVYCKLIRRPFVQVVKGRHVAIDMEPVGMILGPAALGRFGRAVGGKVASDRPSVALVSPWGRLDAGRMRRAAWAVYESCLDMVLARDIANIDECYGR